MSQRPALCLALAACLAASPALAAPWSLSVDGDGANLTNGDASGEDSATSLQCAGGEKKLTVYLFLERRIADHLSGDTWVDKAGKPAPWKTLLTVRSGALTARFPVTATVDEMNGGTEIDAELPTSAPVLRAFARTGAIRFTAFGETVRDTPISAAKAARLMRVCG